MGLEPMTSCLFYQTGALPTELLLQCWGITQITRPSILVEAAGVDIVLSTGLFIPVFLGFEIPPSSAYIFTLCQSSRVPETRGGFFASIALRHAHPLRSTRTHRSVSPLGISITAFPDFPQFLSHGLPMRTGPFDPRPKLISLNVYERILDSFLTH